MSKSSTKHLIVLSIIVIGCTNILSDTLVWNGIIPSIYMDEWSTFETVNLLIVILTIVVGKYWLRNDADIKEIKEEQQSSIK